MLEKIGNTEHLSREVGLGIVREACDELEYQARGSSKGRNGGDDESRDGWRITLLTTRSTKSRAGPANCTNRS